MSNVLKTTAIVVGGVAAAAVAGYGLYRLCQSMVSHPTQARFAFESDDEMSPEDEAQFVKNVPTEFKSSVAVERTGFADWKVEVGIVWRFDDEGIQTAGFVLVRHGNTFPASLGDRQMLMTNIAKAMVRIWKYYESAYLSDINPKYIPLFKWGYYRDMMKTLTETGTTFRVSEEVMDYVKTSQIGNVFADVA